MIRVRAMDSDHWVLGFVAAAGGATRLTENQSVMLTIDDYLISKRGHVIGRGLPLTVNYPQECAYLFWDPEDMFEINYLPTPAEGSD